MKNRLTFIGWTGFVVMTIVCLLLGNCNIENQTEPTKPTIVEVLKWDTVTKKILVNKPYPVPGKDSIITIPQDVDTSEILKKYFTQHIYADTIADTNLVAFINDTVSMNQIKARGFYYKLIKPTHTTTIINNPPIKKKAEFFVGGFTSGTIKGADMGIGFNALLKTKKDIMYLAGYDVINSRAEFGVSVKIKKK